MSRIKLRDSESFLNPALCQIRLSEKFWVLKVNSLRQSICCCTYEMTMLRYLNWPISDSKVCVHFIVSPAKLSSESAAFAHCDPIKRHHLTPYFNWIPYNLDYLYIARVPILELNSSLQLIWEPLIKWRWWWEFPVPGARRDLKRSVKHMHRLSDLSSIGISRHHCLFHHYFINYNEVFSSKIGT